MSLKVGSNKTLQQIALGDAELLKLCEQAVKGCKNATHTLWVIYADILVSASSPPERLLDLFTVRSSE